MFSNSVFMDAVGYVDDTYLEKYFEMKRKHQEKGVILFYAKRLAAAAAVLAVLIGGAAVLVPPLGEPGGTVVDPTATETAPPRETPPPVETEASTTPETSPPDFFHAYATPSLEECYTMAPYSELLPQKILEGCVFTGSYMPVYDPIVAACSSSGYSPDDFPCCLDLFYDIEGPQWNGLEISVDNHDRHGGTEKSAYTNDPYDLNSYRMSWEGGIFKAYKIVLCGEWVVSYYYTGPEITAEQFREMVLSAKYFA